MTQTPRAPHRLPDAGLELLLAAAHDAFEFLLTVTRDHQDPADGMFAAFVMSAASAADGRDAVAAAPSLPWPPPPKPAGAADDFRQGTATEVAAGLGAISQQLAVRLAQAAGTASGAADRAACAEATSCAARIGELLNGPAPS